MAEYYFDIETYSKGERTNPSEDRIITIQFQRIDMKKGVPRGELTILKEWKSSEEQIVKEFYNMFFKEGAKSWDFIPVGFALTFEWEFLINKFEKYIGKKFTSKEFHYSWPHVDIRPMMILYNGGQFGGTKLNVFTKKTSDGSVIRELYEKKEYEKIEKYIKEETVAFLELLQEISKNVKKLLSDEYLKNISLSKQND